APAARIGFRRRFAGRRPMEDKSAGPVAAAAQARNVTDRMSGAPPRSGRSSESKSGNDNVHTRGDPASTQFILLRSTAADRPNRGIHAQRLLNDLPRENEGPA